ncbi:Putative glycoporin [Halomonas citrativorans]|uniref:Glycoporin n=1 Tax=Halomonas citrativorans TaxID=2742612 RepID=A0A1R4I4L3_9GAMM|nr:carbohydrate porin [Halomonas citrativorans]SJN14797.1 Putative glycoporin [Halomonas citrativorans]
MLFSRYKKLPLVVAISLGTTTSAMAAVTYEDERGSISFGGDVELDINAYNEHEGGVSLFRGQTNEPLNRDDRFNQDGRILLDISGERHHGDNYARFKLQPLWGTSGNAGLDDAWLAIGSEQGTEIKVGRFEAYDLFPLGHDIFIQYSGTTSDELYSDGQSYVYQTREGRGRGDSGQIALSHRFDNGFYAEVATLLGNRSGLFDGDTYHGYRIADDTKSAAIVRPVIAWQPGDWSFALGMETNVVKDSVVDIRGEDIGDRTGYGATASYNGNDLILNFSLAHLDAHKETNSSAGVNTIWNNIGLGYIYARNQIDEINPAAEMDFMTPEGRNESNTVYTSYRFADTLGLKDFDTYIGAYYSYVDHESDANSDDTNRYGARIRLKYFF